MSGKRRKRKLIFFGIVLFIIAVIGLDQFFKKAIQDNFEVSESVPVIDDVFHLTYVRNTGTAFGLFKGYNLFFIFVSIVTLVSIVLLLYRENKSFFGYLSLSLILAGAMSNLIDRFFRGYIVDFIDFIIWPVFNLADTAITIGAVLLVIELIRGK